MLPRRLTAILGMWLVSCPAGAAESGLLLDGAVAHPGPVSLEMLSGLPQQSMVVAYGTEHGVHAGRVSGVLLWDVLQQAGLVNDPAKHGLLRHTLMVTGRDGYAVAFSLGELSPAGTADPVLLVRDAGTRHFDVAVPGDHAGARDVHDVVHIAVR